LDLIHGKTSLVKVICLIGSVVLISLSGIHVAAASSNNLLSDGYSLIPAGSGLVAIANSCTHFAPTDSIVSVNATGLTISLPNGNVHRYLNCSQPPYVPSWSPSNVEYGYTASQNPYSGSNGKWVAPGLPKSWDGQAVAIWGGTEDSAEDDVIQGVLQEGNGWANGNFGNNWVLTPWYVYTTCGWFGCSKNAVYGSPINVNVGDSLFESSGDCGVNSCSLNVQDLSNHGVSTYTINTNNKQYSYYASLEAYSLTKCTDYPQLGGGGTLNSQQFVNGQQVNPLWQTTIAYNDGCGENVAASGYGVTLYMYNS
jgi:hypothetical protein